MVILLLHQLNCVTFQQASNNTIYILEDEELVRFPVISSLAQTDRIGPSYVISEPDDEIMATPNIIKT